MTLPFLALAWIAALVATAAWNAPPWMAAAWFGALVPLAWTQWGKRAAIVVTVATALALVAGVRFAEWEARSLHQLAGAAGTDVALRGVVAGEPDPGITTSAFRLDVTESQDATGTWRPADGAVLVRVGQYREYPVGTEIEVAGELEEAPVFDDFDYRGYLARQGIVGTMLFPEIEVRVEAPRWHARRLLADARAALDQSLQRSLPEPAASLGAGIAFGRDGNLPDDLYDDFRRTGLAHIVAVSGSNVALVTAVTFAATVRVTGRKRALIPAAFAVVGYLALTGFSPSVVRAGVMALVYLFGHAIGRPQSSLPALGLAAIAMTAIDPSLALDAGFQLSFAATTGLIVFAPWIRWALERGAEGARIRGWVPHLALDVAAISIAATIATLPITWVTFGQVSLIGPIANILVDPLFVVAFWGSVVTAFAGVVWEPAGYAAGLAAYYPLAAITWLAETLATVPGAAVTGRPAGVNAAIAVYALLAAVAGPMYLRLAPVSARAPGSGPGPVPRRLALGGAAGGSFALVLLVSVLPMRGPGELEIAVLDIGQGDAILVATPGGERVLIDGGPSGIVLARELGAVLPHWERTIDAVVVTHPQADHIGGLPAASDRFRVGAVYAGPGISTSELWGEFGSREPERAVLAAGDRFEVDGVVFEVLWPPAGFSTSESNDLSLVLRVTYGTVDVVLAGDIEAGPQRQLAEAIGDIEVLKVPHHGAGTSWVGFFEAVEAEVAVISAGEGNRFGHPAEETLAALEGAGSQVFRTDRDGRVVIRTDGSHITVTAER